MTRTLFYTVLTSFTLLTAVGCGPVASTDGDCLDGTEGCACAGGTDCEGALVCASDVCVELPVGGDGDGDGGDGDGDGDGGDGDGGDGDGGDGDGDGDEPEFTETVNVSCVPKPLLSLSAIPDDASLDDGNDETVAIFEVDGHDLIGKHVTDTNAAEKGLKLWQEFTTRVPANQLADLVQFEISTDTDPVAYFNRTGNVTTARDGLKIGYSTAAFTQNDANPCAPLTPRRGTFDWSLVHEFGHLIGWLDGSWPRFLDAFPNAKIDIAGFPEDGSPIMTGEFVTSYAARDDGDEDHAETWTTFVMLGDDAIPAAVDGEPISVTKLRWMSEQPGYVALRQAIRISEVGVEPVTVPAAPRLEDRLAWPPSIAGLGAPAWMQGVWRDNPTDGKQVTLEADDILFADVVAGVVQNEVSLLSLQEAGTLFYFERHGGRPALAFSYIEDDADPYRYNIDFFHSGWDNVSMARELLERESSELSYESPIEMVRFDP